MSQGCNTRFLVYVVFHFCYLNPRGLVFSFCLYFVPVFVEQWWKNQTYLTKYLNVRFRLKQTKNGDEY